MPFSYPQNLGYFGKYLTAPGSICDFLTATVNRTEIERVKQRKSKREIRRSEREIGALSLLFTVASSFYDPIPPLIPAISI